MNIKNRDMSYMKKYQEVNPKLYLSKGVKVPRFRKTKKQIKNRILYSLMLSKDIKVSEMANLVGVTHRTANAWIVDGIIPADSNVEKVCSIMDYPSHILFNDGILKSSPIICLPKQSKHYKRVVAVSPVNNHILYGLMILYDISLKDLASFLNINISTLRKYLHNNFLPDETNRKNISDFFKVSESILFYDFIVNSNLK
ncbi:hypothetical protein J2W97_001211 [Paenibacillus jamilae]|nr:hypothetical protein [Paenibacillus jamilae]